MFCPNCGAQAEGGKFCASCGAPLPMLPKSDVPEASPQAPIDASFTAAPQAPDAPQQYGQQAPVPAEPYQWTPQPAPQAYDPYQYNQTPAPLEPQENKTQKPKNKALMWILIAAGGLALLAGIALLVIFVFLKKEPTAQVGAAAARTLSAVKETETGRFASELEKSEVKITMDLSSLRVSQIPIDGTVDVTVSSDMDAGRLSLALAFLMKGKEIADLDLLMDEKAMALSSDTLLGSDVYGLTFKTLPDDLKNSIFNPDAGTDYPLPEDVYNMLLELDESPITLYKEGRGSLEKLAETGGAKLLEALKKHAKVTREDGTVSVGGSKVDCTIVKADADEEATRKIVDELVGWLKENETKKELTRFFGVIAKVQTIANAAEGYRKTVEAEDLLKDFYDELDDGVEDLEDSTAVLSFYINKKNEQLIGFRMDSESDKNESSLEVFAGPDMKDPSEIRIIADMDSDRTEILVDILENSNDLWAAKITADDDGRDQTIEVEWNKQKGNFEISVEGRPVASGSMKIDGDKLSMGIDQIGLTLQLTRGGKTPEVPKFENIVTMKEKDFSALLDDLQKEIQKLILKFMN